MKKLCKRILAFVLACVTLLALAACNPAATVCPHRDADDNGECDKCREAYADGKDFLDPFVCLHTGAGDGYCGECDTTFYTYDGNYIYFGEYPQSLKADAVAVTETTDSRGYYLGSDGAYYAKVTATPYNSAYTFSMGESVADGEIYYFKVEPIRWRILFEDTETAFLFCDNIIANKAFDAKQNNDYSNNYKESSIRAWLNAEFYQSAFTELQQKIILTTKIDNTESMPDSCKHFACEDTNDKVFLLSYTEVTNMEYGFSSYDFGRQPERQMLPSDYCVATGAWMGINDYGYAPGFWWQRSPSYNTGCPIYVTSDGSAFHYAPAHMENGGIVPVLWIQR